MEEASVSQSAPSLRVLFVGILTTCFPSDARRIWNQFRQSMSEDYLFTHRRNMGDPTANFNEQIYNMALCNFEERVIMMGGRQLQHTIYQPKSDGQKKQYHEYTAES